MRRLLAVAVAAAAFTATTPAQAEPTCTGGRIGVCVTVIECSRVCTYNVVVDPYCVQGHPAIGACSTINNLVVGPLPS